VRHSAFVATVLLVLAIVTFPKSALAQVAVVDVGGHPQELLALTVLLKAGTVNLKLVTTHGNSAATLYAATENVREIVNMLGRTDVTVAAGAVTSWQDLPERRSATPTDSATVMAAQDALSNIPRTSANLPTCYSDLGAAPFPSVLAQPSFEMPVPSFGVGTWTKYACDTLLGVADALPVTSPPSSPTTAQAALQNILTTQSTIDYIALGSLTNLAEGLRTLAKSKIALPANLRIHVSGGSKSNGNLMEWLGANTTSVSTYLPNVNPKAPSSWGHFVDPVAVNYVFAYPNLKRYLYTLDVQTTVRMRYSSGDFTRLTTTALDRATKLRSISQPVDALGLEFFGTMLQSLKTFVMSADPNAFDQTWLVLGPLSLRPTPRTRTCVPDSAAHPAHVQDHCVLLDGSLTFTSSSSAVGTDIPTTTYETAQSSQIYFWNFVNSALNLPAS